MVLSTELPRPTSLSVRPLKAFFPLSTHVRHPCLLVHSKRAIHWAPTPDTPVCPSTQSVLSTALLSRHQISAAVAGIVQALTESEVGQEERRYINISKRYLGAVDILKRRRVRSYRGNCTYKVITTTCTGISSSTDPAVTYYYTIHGNQLIYRANNTYYYTIHGNQHGVWCYVQSQQYTIRGNQCISRTHRYNTHHKHLLNCNNSHTVHSSWSCISLR